ncbi:acid protease [Coniophora puteana RWD-64-598 SS2]|uniref:Acid protease n=1 Tax=Coniophora puteana (strain RWD-64-598) TaxID=741705 RepID=A0A5M3N566_CONPW|nr:acid protease [Coniophora puteana RWD-64-598 SS2]EIW85995.1 acid protease [Coniophora puteana RWD-64-598 SS2]
MQNQIQAVSSKHAMGYSNFAVNTGAAHALAANASGVTRGLTNVHNAIWYATVNVGSPSQSYALTIDTGSADVLLPGSNCSSCQGHVPYDPTMSTTSKDTNKTFTIQDAASGELYTETLALMGLTATNQTIAVASNYSSAYDVDNFPADGVLGLAFDSISSVPGTSSVFTTLAAQGQVVQKQFGVRLADPAELTVGGADADAYSGDVTYVPVTQKGFWQIKADSLSVSSSSGNASQSVAPAFTAVVDSGTELILGPADAVDTFYKAVDGAKDNGDGTYAVPCQASFNATITLGGTAFPLAAGTLVLKQDDGTCVGAVSSGGAATSSHWVLGEAFLRNVYSIFDFSKAQIGFAKLA